MGKSLDQLRRENEALRQREFGKQQIKKQKKEDRREKLKLTAENVALKNPKKIRFVKKVGKGAVKVGGFIGKGIVKAGEQYAKAEASRRPQPQKRRKKVKRVRKVKRKNYGDQFGLQPKFSF